MERGDAAPQSQALRSPGKRRSVAHSTGISPLRRFSPRRPLAWTWMSLLETARAGDGYSKPRPCREGATSPTGIEELRMTTEQQVRTVRAAGENGAIRPFRVDIPDESLEDLRQRIAATRLPSKELVEDRSQGVQLATIQELVTYWVTDYDLGRMEARLNALPQFTTEIDGVNLHFLHVRSPHENALPLIMTHGWPGSVVEMIDSVGPLTDPTAHGGSAEDAFHLVLPSLPGYGF